MPSTWRRTPVAPASPTGSSTSSSATATATLWVVEGNARARAFYARRGFVDEGGRDVHPATGTPEIRMVRRA